MDFFNKLGKKVSETYKTTAKAADSIAKEVKLKSEINEIKDRIDEEYNEIGERVYYSHVHEENNSGLEDYISQAYIRIDELFKNLNDKKVEILKLKNKVICPKCNTEIDINVAFCPKCGEKQEVKEVEHEDVQEEIHEEIEIIEKEEDNKEDNQENK